MPCHTTIATVVVLVQAQITELANLVVGNIATNLQVWSMTLILKTSKQIFRWEEKTWKQQGELGDSK